MHVVKVKQESSLGLFARSIGGELHTHVKRITFLSQPTMADRERGSEILPARLRPRLT
jgi:hypothetical protein